MKKRAGSELARAETQVLVGLFFLLGVLTRFIGITKSSIWHDEGFSIILSRQPLVQIWQLTSRDVHPPLYYMVLHVWTKFFGTSVLAIRSLSAFFGIAILAVGYLLVRRIAGNRASLLALLFLALAPFLIRYSQEARMYGMLGFLMISAVYSVVRILEQPRKNLWYVLYGLAVLAGLYTHYFTVLAVGAIWLYILIDNRSLLRNKRWWLANMLAVVGFLPWVPNMIAQLTRGQGLSWLPHTSWQTFFDTTWQFMTFTDGRRLPIILYVFLGIVFVAMGIYVWRRDHTKDQSWHLIVIFSFVPILLAIAVSFVKPVFHERYFMFASIDFYIMLGITVDQLGQKKAWLIYVLTAVIVVLEIIGIRNVMAQGNHQMGQVMQRTVNEQYQTGDQIIAGELYTYFDGSYYNQTGKRMLLYTPNRPNGYGESALLYQDANEMYIDAWQNLPSGGRVWVVGKTGDQSYYNQIPASWKLLDQQLGGYSEVRLYQIQ